jgi:hypothetical protein
MGKCNIYDIIAINNLYRQLIMKKTCMTLAFIFLSSALHAGEYDFNWKSTQHMQGAWMLCATTGFTQGECPKVLRKCFLPPLIRCRRGKCKTRCVGTPSFSVSESDVQKALAHVGAK